MTQVGFVSSRGLVEDGVVEADAEPVDAAARRALERDVEELLAGRVLEPLRVARRAVEVRQLARVGEDDREAERQREVLVDADVAADLEDRRCD